MENNYATSLHFTQRIIFEEIDNHQCNLALAKLLKHELKEDNEQVYILENNQWIRYDPMNDWKQFGEVISSQHLSVSSHPVYNQQHEPYRFWYSCHAHYSDTETNGWNYRNVVAQCCIKLLEKINQQ